MINYVRRGITECPQRSLRRVGIESSQQLQQSAAPCAGASHLPRFAIPFVIHIVEEDAKVRAALSYLLAGRGYKTEIYAAAEELLAQRRLRDGCILYSWEMPGPGVLDLVAELEARGCSTPVIMIGENISVSAAIESLRSGAFDFLQRPYEEAALIAAIERACDRSRVAADQRRRKSSARSQIGRLSARKRQVLQGLLAGMSNKVIAQRLALSPRTVELYRASTMEELEVGNLAEALRMAMDAELTPLSEAPAADPPLEEQDGIAECSSEQTAPLAGDGAIPPLPHIMDILEGTTDCVFLVDHEWRFTYLNANARQLLAGGQDLIGVELWEQFPLAASTRAWDELHRAVADRRPTRFEFYEPDLRSWLDVNVRPYSAGLQVCFRNISHERYSSAQLRLSEENLLHALEAAGDGAWDWDMQTGDVAMSSAFLARLGYGPDAFSPTFDNFVHLVHPDDLPVLTRRLKDHLEGRSESFRCEYRLRRSDGRWLWNLDRGRIVARHPVTALPLRMVGSASDITHIKAAQQTAEEALKRLELAQGNAGVGLWDLDLASGVVRFCERSRAMHGLSPEGPSELTAELWSSTVHDADREQAVAKLQDSIASGETYRICYRTVDTHRAVRWVLGMGRAVSGHDGKAERFVGLNIEITALTALINDADDDHVLANSCGDILPRGDDAIDGNDPAAP